VWQHDDLAGGINGKLGSKGRGFLAVVRLGFVRLGVLRRLQFGGRRFGLGGGGSLQRLRGMSFRKVLKCRGLI
jgi:hypothetical protein